LNLCSGSSFEAPNASTHQVLSHCLESKHDYVSVDYWNALADPSAINSFD